MSNRVIHQWTAGSLIQLQWTYRLVEVDDNLYLLEVQSGNGSFIPAVGHFEARRVSEGLIEEDRVRCRAETEAHEEYRQRDELDRSNIVNIEERKRA